MSEKVYITRKKVTLADGTVKEYTSSRKYIPRVKELKKTEVYKKLLKLDDIDKLKRINEIIDESTDWRIDNSRENGGD